MKARLLRKILNDTKYILSDHADYIAVGGPLCHDLISVDKNPIRFRRLALDYGNKGRSSLDGELLLIYDKLDELMKSGELAEIIEGKDEIENPLPVYWVEDGQLNESATDAHGWPNLTEEGILMYNNTHFPTKEQALKKGISEYESRVKWCAESVEERAKQLLEATERAAEASKQLEHLKSLQSNLKSEK
jgi:hypothetical protein